MGLTSTTTFILAIALTGALLIVPLIAVPLLAARHGARHGGRPGWVPVAVQAVCLILLPVVAAATVFVGVNRTEQWYDSWDDLVAEGRVPTQTHDFGAPAAQRVGRTAALPAQAAAPATMNPSAIPGIGKKIAQADQARARRLGLYVEGSVVGGASGVTDPVGFWLPPQYFTQPSRVFPVIEAFSGIPGQPRDYIDTAHIDQVVRRLSAAHRLAQPIIVIPQAYTSDYDSECVNATQGSGAKRMETWVAQDVPAWVRAHLRARTDPQAWVTLGYSAGGFCAAALTTLHPKQFPHAIVLSGYFQPLYADDQQWRPVSDTAYDLPAILHRTRPPVDLWVYAGNDDQYTTPSLKKLEPQIADPTRLTTVIAQTGGHRWSTWMPGFGKGLARLGQIDPFFAAAQSPQR